MTDKLKCKESSEELDTKITPDNIPTIKSSDNIATGKFQGVPELRKIVNPFDLTPNNPILKMLKIPGVIFASTLSGYLCGKFSVKPFCLILIGHCIYAYYKRRVHQYKLSMNTIFDQEKRIKETAIDSTANVESVEWMNYIVRRVWLNVESSVSSTIHSEVNKVFKKVCPKQLKSIKLSEITLGTQPPVIEKIKWFDRSDDKIVLEMDMAFVPLQDEDLVLANGASRSHWNTCVQLSVVVNNLISLPILVRNIAFAASVHVELTLTKEEPFVKAAKFYFLKVPEVDFVLIPLKIADFMDLPFLSSFIQNTFAKQIGAICVKPNEINVDLSNIGKYTGKKIGVVCIKLHKLISRTEGVQSVSVTIEGNAVGETAKVSGKNPLFKNEVFYAVIKDTTKTINMSVHSEGEKQNGQVFLRNLNKHVFTEHINMVSSEHISNLYCTTLFYQKTEKRKNSAILTMKCRNISNLCKANTSPKLLYNTYVMMTVLNKQSKKKIGEFETKRIFASKNPIFNESFNIFIRDFNEYYVKIAVMDDKDDTQIGYVNVMLSDIHDCRDTEDRTTYKVNGKGVQSGEIDFSWEMEYIDIHREEVSNILSSSEDEGVRSFTSFNESSEVMEEEVDSFSQSTTNTMGMKINASNSTSVCGEEKEDKDLKTKEQKEKENIVKIERNIKKAKEPGAEPRVLMKTVEKEEETKVIPDLSIGIYQLQKIKKKLVNFTKAMEIKLNHFSGKGTYFFVFETDQDIVKLDAFTTKIDHRVRTVLPLYHEKNILIRLFKITANGDTIIGEEIIDMDKLYVQDEANKIYENHENKFVCVFEKIRAEFVFEFGKLKKELLPHKYTFTQLRFDSFDNLIYSLHLHDNKGVHYVTEVFEKHLLVSSGNEVVKLRHDGAITELDLTNGNKQEIVLGKNNKITAHVSIKTVGCDFSYVKNFVTGQLEVHIIKAAKIPPIDNNSADPFVCVYLNKEQIYKTQVKKRTVNCDFNESFTMDIMRNVDKIGFTIFDYNRVSANQMIVFNEFSLCNLVPGYTKHEIIMQDANTGMPTTSTLTVLFNFKR